MTNNPTQIIFAVLPFALIDDMSVGKFAISPAVVGWPGQWPEHCLTSQSDGFACLDHIA